jgi:serine/threonine-protein kinase
MPGAPSGSFLALQSALAGRYALERELGRGGMGIVYLARDIALDRPVAIKLLPPELAGVPAHRERFLREARIAAGLSHPHIVPIHSVEEPDGLALFVMAYIEGDSLGHRLARGSPLAPTEAARILQEVAWALAYAHGRGVVHRDIKPDNILIDRASGRAMVTDFGIAQTGGSPPITGEGPRLGTARYMSPEQVAGTPLDGRSDLYSLGVTALQLFRTELPSRFAPIIERCLAPDPEARFPDGEALAEAIGVARGHRPEVPLPVERFVDLYKTLSTEVATYAAILLVLVAEAWVSRGIPIADVLFLSLTMWGLFVCVGLGVLRFFQLVRRARQLQREGYTLSDVRSALARGAAEAPGPGTRRSGRARRLGFALLGVTGAALWGLAFRWQMGTSLGPVLDGLILAAFTLVPVVLLRGAVGRMLRPGPAGWWSRMWWKVMDWKVFRLARLGEGRTRVPASEPTEAMLGAGAQDLFRALPADLRTQFREVPAVINRLEARARQVREARGDQPDGQLTSTLAAMEQLRLDLLRLRAQAAGTGELTADLDAARRLGDRIDELLAGKPETS